MQKKDYKLIYKSNLNTKDAINSIKNNFNLTKEIKEIINFIENSERGLI